MIEKEDQGAPSPGSLRWLRLDELQNAIDSLEMVALFLRALASELKWKWACIAAHQALYGFAVCATKASDASLSLRDPENRTSHLISVWKALERAKDRNWMPWEHCVPLETSTEEDWAIDKLVEEFRNEFEHFRPKSWSIEVSGMPSILTHTMRVIKHMALDAQAITYTDDTDPARITTALGAIDKLLRREAGA